MTPTLLLARCFPLIAALGALALQPLGRCQAEIDLDPRIAERERQRVAIVQRVCASTIAIFDSTASSGGSGVIISSDGLALTNFHVVAPCGPFMTCGLPDGRLVGAVIVGVDPTGDVALIQLLDEDPFPAAEFGDSDLAAPGDEVFVAGNPFLLAHDFQPSVSFGILSGTHRYQYPTGTVLEYADCLQTDASINPGNSGGPLFDAEGKLIGVNGRASFEKRGRVNVGVGYAISINQIARFLSQLKSGRIVDHASLGATVRTASHRRVMIDRIDEDSHAFRLGLRYGDELLTLNDRETSSANALQNALATYPPGWRVPIAWRRGFEPREASVRLSPLHGTGELRRVVEKQVASPAKVPYSTGPNPSDWYEARPGYANYFFNRRGRDRTLENCPQRNSEGKPEVPWRITAKEPAGAEVTLSLGPDRCEFRSERGKFWIDGAKPLHDQIDPPGSRGMLTALQLWRSLLVWGAEAFEECEYFGTLPWQGESALCDCLVVRHQGVRAEFLFETQGGNLVGIELFLDEASDTCRVFFSEFAGLPGALPRRIAVWSGEELWIALDQFQVPSRTSEE